MAAAPAWASVLLNKLSYSRLCAPQPSVGIQGTRGPGCQAGTALPGPPTLTTAGTLGAGPPLCSCPPRPSGPSSSSAQAEVGATQEGQPGPHTRVLARSQRPPHCHPLRRAWGPGWGASSVARPPPHGAVANEGCCEQCYPELCCQHCQGEKSQTQHCMKLAASVTRSHVHTWSQSHPRTLHDGTCIDGGTSGSRGLVALAG
jgi:hypothetical protein